MTKQVLLVASVAFLIAIAVQLLRPYLLPHGPAVAIPPEHRLATSVVDPNNASLRFSGGKLTRIVERVEDGRQPLLVKPETVVFNNKGVMYIMNQNAKLVSLTDFERDDRSDNKSIMTAKATEVADLGLGVPLGGKFDRKGCLYFADVILGLARICNLPANGKPSSSSKPNVELVASRVKLDDGSWSPIIYADDVDVGPKTGHVYFSDASDVKTDRDHNTNALLWDQLYASKLEGIRGKRTGRILRYKPESGEVDILVASGAAFANGVAVDKDESYVLYISTFEGALMKYHLNSKREGPERLLGDTGILDGVDCSFQRGLCYIAVVSTVSPFVATLFSMPSWIRSLVLMVPRNWIPAPQLYGGAAEIHPGDGNTPARIIRLFQDPDGRDVRMVAGVTEHKGNLYIGSLHSNFVSVVSLD